MAGLDFLENSRWWATKPYAEPAAIAQRPAPGPFYAHERAVGLPIGIDTIGEMYAPASRVRHDPYNQASFENTGANVNGQAPTQGIYTGVGDYE